MKSSLLKFKVEQKSILALIDKSRRTGFKSESGRKLLKELNRKMIAYKEHRKNLLLAISVNEYNQSKIRIAIEYFNQSLKIYHKRLNIYSKAEHQNYLLSNSASLEFSKILMRLKSKIYQEDLKIQTLLGIKKNKAGLEPASGPTRKKQSA